MSKLPVSVVIPARNRAHFLARAIASAKAQVPYPPGEIIVVDDGSTDETAAVAEAMGAFVIHHERSLGSGLARNTGISRATQPWIAFLDSDDEWFPWHLAWLWPHTDSYSIMGAANVVRAASSTTMNDNTTATEGRHGPQHGQPNVYSSPAQLIKAGNPLATSTVLVKKSVIEANGGFRPFPQAQDFDLWIRIVERYPVFISDRVTAIRKLHNEQISANREAAWKAADDVINGFRDRSWWTPTVLAHYNANRALEQLRTAKETHSVISVVRTLLRLFIRSPRAFISLPTIRKQRRLLWSPSPIVIDIDAKRSETLRQHEQDHNSAELPLDSEQATTRA